MIEINLLPEELRKKDEKFNLLAELPIKRGAIIFVGLFLALQLLSSVYAFYLSTHFKMMQSEAQSLAAANKQITARKAETLALKKKIEKGEATAQRPFYWATFLNALSSSATKGVWLTNLSTLNDGKLGQLRIEGSVVGRGEETAYAGKFIKELKENIFFNDLFDSIELSTINQKKIKDFDVYDFVILCKFKKGKL